MGKEGWPKLHFQDILKCHNYEDKWHCEHEASNRTELCPVIRCARLAVEKAREDAHKRMYTLQHARPSGAPFL